MTVAAAPVVVDLPIDVDRPAGKARIPPSIDDVPAAPVALCAAALGYALQVNLGQYHPVALLWLSVALLGLLLCIAKPQGWLVRLIDSRRSLALGIAVAIQFILLLTRSPGATGSLAGGGTDLLTFRIGIVVAALACVAGFTADGRWRACATGVLLLTYALLGGWVLRAAPNPGVDVCVIQREAADALLRGENPYALTFRDPHAGSSEFYGPGVSANGRLQFGYPYPPLSLLLVTPGHWLGDFRYAQLAATTLAAAMMAMARPGRVAFAAAALLLFTPRGFFVLEAGWTEPFGVLFLTATVFAACRARRSLPVPLGLLLVSKQYLPLALLGLPILKWDGYGWRGLLWKAAAVGGAVTLPLALWDVSAFVHSAIALQFRQPFRDDALSYLVPIAQLLGGHPPAWVPFVLAGLVGTLLLCKGQRTPAGFACGVALVFLVFFAFNKQAFCNYYHFVIGALCCAIGAANPAWCARPLKSDGGRTV